MPRHGPIYSRDPFFLELNWDREDLNPFDWLPNGLSLVSFHNFVNEKLGIFGVSGGIMLPSPAVAKSSGKEGEAQDETESQFEFERNYPRIKIDPGAR